MSSNGTDQDVYKRLPFPSLVVVVLIDRLIHTFQYNDADYQQPKVLENFIVVGQYYIKQISLMTRPPKLCSISINGRRASYGVMFSINENRNVSSKH